MSLIQKRTRKLITIIIIIIINNYNYYKIIIIIIIIIINYNYFSFHFLIEKCLELFGLSTFNPSVAHTIGQFFLGVSQWKFILQVQSLRYLLSQCSQIVMPIIFRSDASFSAKVRQKSLSATKNKRLLCNA